MHLPAIVHGKLQARATGFTEQSAVHKLFSHGNDYEIKEPKFAFEPSLGWITLGTSLLPCEVSFFKQANIPTDVRMPLLHGMRRT